MTLRAMWSRRAQEFADAMQRERARERAAGLRPGGMMPHWSRTRSRDGVINRIAMHALRPLVMGIVTHTCCGWPEPAFHMTGWGGKRFPRHKLMPLAGRTPSECVAIAEGIGCQACYDVLDDIATWRELHWHNETEDSVAHLKWPNRPAYAACNTPIDDIAGPMLDYDKFVITRDSDQTRCACCNAIFHRLWGDERPEKKFDTFETPEQVARGVGP